MDEETIKGLILIGGLAFSLAYVFISALFEHKRILLIHQTGVAMVIGILIGLFLYFFLNSNFQSIVNLNDGIVFFVLLPLMLFSEGYNLKKRRFFQNIFYVNIYGLFGTLLNFITMTLILYGANKYGLVRDFGNHIRDLSIWEILLFSATMCSMEGVAALSSIKPDDHPKLFSVIFGESVMKDVVTIVLFKSINNLITDNQDSLSFDFEWYSCFQILGQFLLTVVVSLLIGIIYGLILTFVFKTCRFIEHTHGIAEFGLTFMIGLLAYLTCQVIGYSGIISMMIAGILLSHFNTYNMSHNGVIVSKISFKTISIIAQGLLFLVLGLSSWEFANSRIEQTTSWSFILFAFLALIIGRVVNIGITTLMFYFCVGKKNWRLNIYELQIIFVCGIVKGAVPFALVSSLELGKTEQQQDNIILIKSTVIVIVLVTSLLFNGLIPFFIKWKIKAMKQNISEDHYTNVDTLKQEQIQNYQGQLRGETEEERKYRSVTQKYWKRFEEGFLKPCLIYNYRSRRDEIIIQKKKQRFEEFGIPMLGYRGDIEMANLEKPTSLSVEKEKIEINPPDLIGNQNQNKQNEDRLQQNRPNNE